MCTKLIKMTHTWFLNKFCCLYLLLLLQKNTLKENNMLQLCSLLSKS